MCETLQVSKSGYYDWVDRVPCAREKANEALALQIHSAFTASDETYGMLRVRAQLRDEGIRASRKRVARLMRQNHKLVTGDGLLRKVAGKRLGQVYGLLWLLDQVVDSGKVPMDVLREGLSKVADHPRTRLPADEIRKRLEAWNTHS